MSYRCSCSTLRGAEVAKSLVEIVAIGPKLLRPGHQNSMARHSLQPILKHRTINLAQDIFADVNEQVGRDAKNILVVG